MNIFITGATSGIGLEVAKLFMAKGHTVGTCSFFKAEEVIDSLPKGLVYYEADVTDKDKMSASIHDFAKKHGSLDICYANAGISMDKMTFPDFDRGRKIIDINIHGVLNTFEPSLEIMKKTEIWAYRWHRIYIRFYWYARYGHLWSFKVCNNKYDGNL